MRTERRTIYIADDGKEEFKSLEDCIKYEENQAEQRYVEEQWKKFVNSLTIINSNGKVPLHYWADGNHIYTYIQIKNEEEMEKLNKFYKIHGGRPIEKKSFPCVLVFEHVDSELKYIHPVHGSWFLYDLDFIKNKTIEYWSKIGYDISIKKSVIEESEER